MFAIEKYSQAQSLTEAIALLVGDPKAQALAGGTDILVKLREEMHPVHLVSLHAVPELSQERLDAQGHVFLGAGLSFSQVVASPLVNAHVPVLAQAADQVAGPQVRNMGTLGGNICNGAVSADLLPPLLVLDAWLHLAGPGGQRRILLSAFHKGPGKVDLAPGELLVCVEIEPAAYRASAANYCKYAMRAAMDIATIGCAACVQVLGGQIQDIRLAYGVAAPTPIRCVQAEAAAKQIYHGRDITPELVEQSLQALAQVVEEDVRPRTSWRATKEFRLHIIKTLARRVTQSALDTLLRK